jgi:hypothetical protein
VEENLLFVIDPSRAGPVIYYNLQRWFAVFAGCFSLLFRPGAWKEARVSALKGKILAVFLLYYQRDQRSRQLGRRRWGAFSIPQLSAAG